MRSRNIKKPPASVLVIWLVLAMGCGERKVSWFYSSLAEAKTAKDGPRSWVPEDLLPSSSRNIRIVGELSPSREWCSFDFSPGDGTIFEEHLNPVVTLPRSLSDVPSPNVAWWPAPLEGKLAVDKLHNSGYRLFMLERSASSASAAVALIAVDPLSGHAFVR